MSQQNFSNKSLHGNSFKDRDLSGADFSCSQLENVNFTNAILKDTNFSNSRILGCRFDRAIVTNSRFDNSTIEVSNIKVFKTLVTFLFTSVIVLLFSFSSSSVVELCSSTEEERSIEFYTVSIWLSIVVAIFTGYQAFFVMLFNQRLYIAITIGAICFLFYCISQLYLNIKRYSQTHFCGSDLTQSSFTDATIEGVNFSDAILLNVKWSSDSLSSPTKSEN